MSNSPRLVDFPTGLVIFVLSFARELAQRASAVFLGKSNYRRTVINPANQNGFWG